MTISLKDWSKDDPEQGRLYTNLRVASQPGEEEGQQTSSEPQVVLVQPNVPDRGRKLISIARSLDQEQASEEPTSPTPQQPNS